MMRIAIDGYNLAMPRGTGVATYGFSLAKTLQDMGHALEGVFGLDVGRDVATRELLFFDSMGQGGHRAAASEMRRSVGWQIATTWRSVTLLDVPASLHVEKRGFADRLPTFSRLLSSPFLFELAYARLKYFGSFLTVTMPDPPAIMHWTYPIPIRMRGAKNIYTVHDLVPLRLPYATLDDKRLYARLVRWCVETGDHVCTVSEASRDDILSRYDVPADKVSNTYQTSPIPADVAASSPSQDALIIEAMFGLKNKGYFLFFGAIDPKKNLHRIIDAHLTANAGYPLVVVSARDWGMEGSGKQKDGTASAGFLNRPGVIQLDYLPRSMLFRLIRTARAVMFPSLFEGFGLPALEAIELGTPVIASNTSSLPEVVGDAGVLVDPYSVPEIAAAMQALATDEALRARLVAAGPAQLEKFSEDCYRERLAKMYSTTLAL